jgi:hypothetical protein
MLSEIDLSFLVPYLPLIGATLASVIAAIVAVHGARTSLRAARVPVARDYLQSKIAALSDAVSKLYAIDFYSPVGTYAEALAFSKDDWRIASGVCIRHVYENYARLRSAVMPVGHLLTPERQVAAGNSLSDAGRAIDALAKVLLQSPQNENTIGEFFKPFHAVVSDLSKCLQEETEEAVRRLEHEAGLKQR